jgi:hypothetical protein
VPLPDGLWVGIAPNDSVWAAPGAYDLITRPIRSIWYRRGKKRAQQRVEAGECRVVFDNRDRSLDPMNRQSPWWPNLSARRQFVVLAQVGAGPIETIFRGITSGWRPRWQLNDATSTLEGTDRLALTSERDIPSLLRIWAQALRPMWWFPMDEGGGTYLYNIGRERIDAIVAGAELTGQSPAPYEDRTSASFKDPASLAVIPSYARMSPPWSLSAVYTTTGPGYFYSQGPTGGGGNSDITFGVRTTAPVGVPAALVYDGGAPAQVVNGATVVTDGRPHVSTATYDGSTLKITTDFEAAASVLASSVIPRSGANYIGNGLELDRAFGGQLAHLMGFDRVLSDAEISAYHGAVLAPWYGRRSSDRFNDILAWLGVDVSDRYIELGEEFMGAARLGASARECLDICAATETGLFLCNREGRFAFYSRTHAGTMGSTYDTNPTGTSHLPLRELEPDMDERTFFTVAKPKISTPKPVELLYRHPNANQLGDIPWEPETEYLGPVEADNGAHRAVGTGEPVPHLTNAQTIATAATMHELLTLDVWDRCKVIGHPPDAAGDGPFMLWSIGTFWGGPNTWGGPGPMTQTSRILEVEVDIDCVQKIVTVTRDLEPAP